MLAWVPLHHYHSPSKRICLTHGIPLLYPLTDTLHHKVLNWGSYQTMTYRSMITARTDIDPVIIQLSTLMAVVKSSETNCRTRRITRDDHNYHDYRPRLLGPANERNRMRSMYCVQHHSYESIESNHQAEKLQCTKLIGSNDDNYHEYSIRGDQWGKSNTIPTSQLSPIISRRTYNQLCDLIR